MKETIWLTVLILSLSLGIHTCNAQSSSNEIKRVKEPAEGLSKATFAGGCFWCMEAPFEVLDGVKLVKSGHTKGDLEYPTYRQVARGNTGHVESVIIHYDPDVITYDSLLYVFWRNIKPTQANGQFYDIGSQYKTYIFYHNEKQKMQAEKSKLELARSGKFDRPIATEILKAPEDFWLAEDYHQNYYYNRKSDYMQYYIGSGRRDFIKNNWSEYYATFQKQKKQLKQPK